MFNGVGPRINILVMLTQVSICLNTMLVIASECVLRARFRLLECRERNAKRRHNLAFTL